MAVSPFLKLSQWSAIRHLKYDLARLFKVSVPPASQF